MNERKHISLVDPKGESLKIYAGIPTIIPRGSYVFNETVDDDFIICGEMETDIIWSFSEKRWITPDNWRYVDWVHGSMPR